MNLLIGLLIPFFGTMIGSSFVFFLRYHNKNIEKILLSLASGIMVAASIWSLLIPSIEMVKDFSFLPATIGFSIGIFLLYIIYSNNKTICNSNRRLSKMITAIILHNIPEGMAVGVCLSAALLTDAGISLSSAMALSIGIAIQNIPEGSIISLPLRSSGCGKKKSFLIGVLSGIVEPIAGFITILLTGVVASILPVLLGFAAGAMMFVVVDELIPESRKNYKYATIFFSIGFLIMMILDVFFG